MTKVTRISLAEMTVEVLLEGLKAGRWRSKLPGQHRLAKELGVSRQTVGTALARLVNAGVISSSGPRKVPVILQSPHGRGAGSAKARQLRIALLIMRPLEEMGMAGRQYVLQVLMDLQSDGHHGLLLVFQGQESTSDGLSAEDRQ